VGGTVAKVSKHYSSQQPLIAISIGTVIMPSGGFKVGGARGKTKKGPTDDVIILSQPW